MAAIKDPVNPTAATTAATPPPGDGLDPGLHTGADAIEDDIDRTRAEMDRTFDALGRKLAPGQLLEDGWDTVREKTTAGATRLWELAREHPLPALTVGLGVGWLVVDALRGGPSLPLPARWRRHRGAGGSEMPDRVQTRVRRARGGLRELVEERPLAVGAASLAIGLLAGLALPATEREDELLGDARDEMVESARAAGREALDKGIEVASSAVERVKESVREQELTPEQLTGKARHVARDAAETLRDAERQVVGSLTGSGQQAPAWNPAQPPTGTPPRL